MLVGNPLNFVRVIPRMIVPGVWHWRIDLAPDTLYLLIGEGAEDSHEMSYALIREQQRTQPHRNFPTFGDDEYSRVNVPADPYFRSKP